MYASWGARVAELAKSRKIPTRNTLPLFLVSRWRRQLKTSAYARATVPHGDDGEPSRALERHCMSGVSVELASAYERATVPYSGDGESNAMLYQTNACAPLGRPLTNENADGGGGGRGWWWWWWWWWWWGVHRHTQPHPQAVQRHTAAALRVPLGTGAGRGQGGRCGRRGRRGRYGWEWRAAGRSDAAYFCFVFTPVVNEACAL